MLDDFAFEVINNHELAAKLIVQDEYYRLSTEMTDEMEKNIKLYQGNELDLKRLNEIFKKISGYYIYKFYIWATEISKKCKGVLYYTEGYSK
jgi:hypothetical protein